MKLLRIQSIIILLACLIFGQPAYTSANAQPAPSGLAAEVPPENPDWQIKAVDQHALFSVGEVSSHESRSFAIDPSGHPHIVFGEDRLYYAYHNGTSWLIEPIDPYLGGVSGASLVLDNANNPYVSYCRQSGISHYRPLMYAIKNAGQWVNVVVDNSSDACGATSIGRDSQGDLKIAYFRPGTGEIRIAAKSPTFRWSYNTVLATGLGVLTSVHLNLVIGSDDLANVGYYNGNDLKLYYIKETTSGWGAAEMVSNTISMDGFNSLALDSTNQPHFSYVNANGLIYTSRTPAGVWNNVVAREDVSGQYYKENSLVIDTFNQPHIVYHRYYYENTNRYEFVSFSTGTVDGVSWFPGVDVANLPYLATFYAKLALTPGNSARVAYLSFPDLVYASEGTPWSSQIVDTTRFRDGQTSLALDSSGLARISYYDVWNADLKYAAQINSGWDLLTLDSTGDVGEYSAISIGPDGLSNVAYYDATNGDLKLAFDDGGGWQTVTIDSTGDVGQSVSMKSDSNGNLHFSYYDATVKRLKYAFYDYLHAPTFEIVDGTVGTGKTSALILDANNKPYIAYYDQSVGSVNLAVKPGSLWQIINADSTVGTTATGEGIALARVPGGFMLAYGVWTSYPSPIKVKTCAYTLIGISGNCAWSPTLTIDASTYPEKGISLAAAPNGKAYIAYNSETSETLRVVTCQAGVCSQPEIPDPTTVMNGRFSSMALSPSQQPRISYIDVVFKGVKLAVHLDKVYLPALGK